MGRLIILFLVLGACIKSTAQDFERAEYFFDNDPGPGNGTAITLSATATPLVFTTTIPTTSQLPGFHYLAIRVKEAGGPWGLFESRGFYISVATTNAADITDAEYFFDTDPGKGNGIDIPVTAGATTNFTLSIPTSLGPGFHFLAIRTKSSDGVWGLFEARGFYISAVSSDASDIVEAEYYFDTDPGTGNGTSLSIPSGATSFFSVSLPATSLSPGFHFLSIRTKGSDGKWGLFEARGFYIGTQTSDAPDIIAAEYFVDSDPGLGNGIPLTVDSPGATVNQSFIINMGTLSAGLHTLAIRVQAADGKWSFIETGEFTIGDVNQLPVANAGEDQTITLPIDSVTLDGSASSDADGEIASFSWTRISGPIAGSIATPEEAITKIRDLTAGVYEYELTITDNLGAINKDTIQVTVNPAPNQTPIANAGNDQIITLPENSIVLNGSASEDTDGTLATFAWTKISGPVSSTIVDADQAVTTVTDLTEGIYLFELIVTDNNNANDKDTVQVTVNAALPCPSEPVITQSGNQLNANIDGVAYQWYSSGAPIDGAINKTLEISVIENGNYAVEVTSNGCTIRSSDFAYIITASEKETNAIKIFPNPVADKITIETTQPFAGAVIKLIDVLGREVLHADLSAGSNEINTDGLSAGVYYIYLNGRFGFKIQKL